MIDHISICVRNLDRAARFYEAVLATIEYKKLQVQPHSIGFGKTYSEFWINLRSDMPQLAADSGGHVALRARSSVAVDAFYAAALAAGATPDGAPGPRSEYSPGYYAAFIRDPDGNRIEVVTFLRRQ
jgi:catechol 2,3-dioxygenase-like lactoylglutathione lyase family enzyme